MAIGSARGGNVKTGSGKVVIPASCKGIWITAHDDLEQTVPATPLNPATITDSTFHWVKVPEGATRCLLRAQATKTNTVTTDPIVRLYGVYPSEDAVFDKYGDIINEDGSFDDDGTILFMRLDLAETAGTGITLDIETNHPNRMFDAHATPKAYSNPPTITPYDLLGAWYIGVVPLTASATSAGVVKAQVLFIN